MTPGSRLKHVDAGVRAHPDPVHRIISNEENLVRVQAVPAVVMLRLQPVAIHHCAGDPPCRPVPDPDRSVAGLGEVHDRVVTQAVVGCEPPPEAVLEAQQSEPSADPHAPAAVRERRQHELRAAFHRQFLSPKTDLPTARSAGEQPVGGACPDGSRAILGQGIDRPSGEPGLSSECGGVPSSRLDPHGVAGRVSHPDGAIPGPCHPHRLHGGSQLRWPPPPPGLVEAAETGFGHRPQHPASVPVQSPDLIVRQAFGLLPDFPTRVADPTRKTGPHHANPDRALAILIYGLHRTGR